MLKTAQEDKKILAIIATIITKPDVWLLDEPTNHLDLHAIMLLEQAIVDFKGAVIVISHDRQLLTNTTTNIIELDNGKLYHTEHGLTKTLEIKKKRTRSTDSF